MFIHIKVYKIRSGFQVIEEKKQSFSVAAHVNAAIPGAAKPAAGGRGDKILFCRYLAGLFPADGGLSVISNFSLAPFSSALSLMRGSFNFSPLQTTERT